MVREVLRRCAATVVTVGALLALGGCGDERSPVDAVRGYMEPGQRGDCGAVREEATEKLWSMDGAQSKEEAIATCKENGAVDSEVGTLTPSPSGDNPDVVNVRSKVTANGESRPFTFRVIRDHGSWKVDGIRQG
jgi:hypothetical protein